ncbi:MAG: hypothetical protein AAGA77_23245 [Bacteroidota bacterium]
MARFVFLTFWMLIFSSCGKDVVIVEEPVPTEENDVVYEVNLIGFSTDEGGIYLADGKVEVDNLEIESDETGLFFVEKVLVGKRGKVITVRKDGYLPSINRIANHGSLEEVVLNLQTPNAPDPISVPISGGSIADDNGMLTIPENATAGNTDFVFKIFTGGQVNSGNSDQLFITNEVEFLLKESSFYVSGSEDLNTNGKLNVELSSDQFKTNDVDKLSVFHFDGIDLIWKKIELPIEQFDNKISFEIERYGWWTVAEHVLAEYGTLELNQPDEVIQKAEVRLAYGNARYHGSTVYTSNSGEISTYFPKDMSLTTTLNNGVFAQTLTSGISDGMSNAVILFDEVVQTSFTAKSYACDFSESKGFVAILDDGQHKIEQLDNGIFESEALVGNEDIEFNFYTENLSYINSSSSGLESILNENNNFLACKDLDDNLIVSDGTELIEDFDRCRIKVRPKETVVIGERSDGEVFLVSFDGQKPGIYDGVFYNDKVLEDVKSDVIVNIVLYDEETQKVGGYINTEYISSGEDLIISFIGNIE